VSSLPQSKGEVTQLKNAVFLIMGSGIAQAIPLLFSPILSRIYTPSHFGDLAFFTATVAIATMVATGLYELAIVLPRSDRQAFQLLGLVITIAICVSAVSLFLIAIFRFSGIRLHDSIDGNILLIPLGILFNALFQGLNYWLNRKKGYLILNICRISQSLAIVGVSLLLGWLGAKEYGLVLGYVVGGLFSIIPLFHLLIKHHEIFTIVDMKKVAIQHLNFPKLMLPTSGMNTAAGQAPVFMLRGFYDNAIVGSYGFATRILTAPLAIISVAIGQVFYRNLAEIEHTGDKNLITPFKRTAGLLVVFSFLVFTPLYFWGEFIFGWIFGANWLEAGKFVQIIALGTAVRFVVSPLSTVFYVTNRLRLLAIWQTVYFVSTITVFLIASGLPINNLLFIYSMHEVIMYCFYFVLMLVAIKKHTGHE
jgi:teichuronic acid exporter